MGSKNLIQILLKVDGANKATKDIKSVSSATSGLGSIAGKVATSAGLLLLADQAIKFGAAAFEASSDVERLGVATEAMSRRIGSSEVEMLHAIQDASGGTVDQLTSLGAANKAMMFGLVENSGQMKELTTIARVLGNAMGQDTAKSVEDLTTALGRQSPLILDNLGLLTDVEGWQRKYAESIGVAVEALTDEQKKQAFVNGALEEGRRKVEELGGVSVTAADSSDRLKASWADLTVVVGDHLAPAIEKTNNQLADFMDNISGTLSTNRLKDTATEIEMLQARIAQREEANPALFADKIRADKAHIKLLQNEDRWLTSIIGTYKEMGTAQRASLALEQQKLVAMEAQEVQSLRLTAMAEQQYGVSAVQLPSGFAQTMIDNYFDTGEEAGKAFSTAFNEQQSEISTAVSSVLSAGTGVLGDLGLDSFLGENVGRDVAEDARRVAAIMVGDFNGEAAQLLEQSNPELFKRIMESEDPQATAKKILQDFQLGIGAADIIDKDAAKERVKVMIYGTRDLKALNDEITKELLGEGFSQDEISGAMNTASPIAGGISDGLPKAFEDAGTGKILLDTLTMQITGREEEYTKLGKVFAEGFNTALPDAMGTTAGTFLEAVAANVAEQLGIEVE